MCITGENTTRLSPAVQQLVLEAIRSPRQARVTIVPTFDGRTPRFVSTVRMERLNNGRLR